MPQCHVVAVDLFKLTAPVEFVLLLEELANIPPIARQFLYAIDLFGTGAGLFVGDGQYWLSPLLLQLG